MTPEQLSVWQAFIPLIAAVIAVIGGGIVYYFQKSIDRKNQILQERRALYRSFVSNLQEARNYIEAKEYTMAISAFNEHRVIVAQLFVTAPDSVVNALKPLDKSTSNLLVASYFEGKESPDYKGESQKEAEGNFEKKLETLLVEMRRDSFESTVISEIALSFIFPTSAILGPVKVSLRK